MPREDNSNDTLKSILIPIVIALAVGGSGPWWWSKVFPSQDIAANRTEPVPHRDNPDQLDVPDDKGPAVAAAGSNVTGDTPPVVKVAAPSPTMSALLVETNLYKHDLADAGTERATPQACSDACLVDEACEGMTFVKHPTSDGGVCWLKSAGAAAVSNPGMTSATKVH